MQIRVLHSNSYIHPFIYLYIYIYLFTGKTEKYRIFPKKSKKQKNPEEKQKRDNSSVLHTEYHIAQ